MLSDEKILITGPAGRIAYPLCKSLSADNEVWGVARFSEEGSRERVEALGVTTRVGDLAAGQFDGLPGDFTVLLHLASFLGGSEDYDYALRVNAEGTGLLLGHCRTARAALVMSTTSVYRPNDDPWHLYQETDPLGAPALPAQPSYGVSKVAEEAVARYCARAFDLPVVIARMNAAYGTSPDELGGGLEEAQLEAILAGRPVVVRHDPCPYSPIAYQDVCAQVEGILSAASVPASIVNWGGDEAVSTQDWCRYLAELAGVEAKIVVEEAPGAQIGVALDVTRRLALTGPCTVPWRVGMRRMYEARHAASSS
jgi:nucleoside-diphosphate-sugar epimerase